MKSKVIAIVNQKGGGGKTTTTLNLGYSLANRGHKVLLIDLDPQGSLTVSLGINNNDNLQNTIAKLMAMEIMDEQLPRREEFILPIGKLDLIPCNIELAGIEVSLVNAISRETILKHVIEEIRNEYIIIDCSPSLGMLTINASNREHAVKLIQEAVHSGVRLFKACEELGISKRTFIRWSTDTEDSSLKYIDRKGLPEPGKKGKQRK